MEQPVPELKRKSCRSPWESPTLRVLGSISELTQGKGKTGGHADADPFTTAASGPGPFDGS